MSGLSVRLTPEFQAWLRSIRDGATQRRLVARLRTANLGLLGDVQSVGSGVMEMREHFGPGWRMYFVRRGAAIIVMLGGGEKSSQATDIQAAIRLAAQIED